MDNKAAAAFDVYKVVSPRDDPSYQASPMMSKRMFTSDSMIPADRTSTQNATPVYAYRVAWEPRVINLPLSSPQGSDMPLVFGTKDPCEFVGEGPEVDRLSDQLMTAWLNFTRHGDPSQPGLEWPRYDATKRLTMIFDAPCKVVSDPDPVARDPVARGVA